MRDPLVPETIMANTPPPAADGLPSAVPTPADAPPRAVWTANVPSAPWCPDEWRAALEHVAPGVLLQGSASGHTSGGSGNTPYGETMGGRVTGDGWSLVVASRRGRLHAHRGEHREDAGTLLRFSTGWVAAIADGAGSAAWSRLGSAIATHVVAHAVRERLAHGDASATGLLPALRDAALATHAALRWFAEAVEIPPKALRTTLLVVARHGTQIGVLQVGDGAMTLRRTSGTLLHPHAAATGDFSGEVTHFLPDDGAVEQLVASASVHDAETIDAVLIATDGVEDPWYPFTRHAHALFDVLTRGLEDDAVLPEGVTPAWRTSVTHAADPVHALAEWLAFEKRGENDDRTLCLIQRHP